MAFEFYTLQNVPAQLCLSLGSRLCVAQSYCRHSLATCQGAGFKKYLDTILKALAYEVPDTGANSSVA